MNQNEQAERDNVAQANRDSLSKVLEETGMAIPPWEFNKWRPTERILGCIDGMPVNCWLLATDGILGIFKTTTTEGHGLGAAFKGHVEWFRWSEPRETQVVIYSKELKRWMIFTVTKDSGAPPAFHGLPKKTAKPPIRVKKGTVPRTTKAQVEAENELDALGL